MRSTQTLGISEVCVFLFGGIHLESQEKLNHQFDCSYLVVSACLFGIRAAVKTSGITKNSQCRGSQRFY